MFFKYPLIHPFLCLLSIDLLNAYCLLDIVIDTKLSMQWERGQMAPPWSYEALSEGKDRW